MSGKKNASETGQVTTPMRRWWAELSWMEKGDGPRWRDLLLFALPVSVVYFFMLGSFGLWDPWEPHYGEVGRQIVERQDWISLWWGAHWEGGGGRTEGAYFFSKPVLLMWMIAFGIELFGVNPWAVRLGVALTATAGVVAIYAFGASVFRRRTAVVMATVVGTSPFWAMLGRQAQTDMPFVGMMTIGMCLFMIAVFGKDRTARAGRWAQLAGLGFIAAIAIPQISLILMGLSRWRGPEIEWMVELTSTPMTVVSIWGALLIGAGLLTVGSLMWRHRHRHKLALIAVVVIWLPLVGMLIALSATGGDLWGSLVGWFIWGPVQASLYSTAFGVALYLTLDRPVVTRDRICLLCFYAFVGLATLAKGLLGFLLPGAILFVYLLITRRWALLKRVELLRGTLVFVAVAVPWYAAMLIRHNPGFWNRFFVHDHFNRFSSGVHALSDGSFEHFVRWLGYGLLPWSALVPAALVWLFASWESTFRGRQGGAALLLVLWAAVSFTLFSLSTTTFHHYIFPAVPALAMLVGLAVDDLLDRRHNHPTMLYAVGALLIAVIAWDLVGDPQQFKNLYTYRYDRNWDHQAWDGGFQIAFLVILLPMVVGTAMLAAARSRAGRRWGLASLFLGAIALTLFSLNIYMPAISGTMSQQSIWDRYYEVCEEAPPPPRADRRKRFCREPAIGYKLNWRGETYHTQNEVIPIRNDDDWEVFLEEVGDGPYFAIMQHHRYRGEFQRNQPDRFEGKTCLVHNTNLKFALAKVPCAEDDPDRVDGED